MTELYADVVGQERAVAQLRAAARSPVHAYLLVGGSGTGTREAATSFAASLLCPHGGCGSCEVCRRVVAGVHPDVVVHERAGPYITVESARAIGRAAALSPVEAGRKVLVLVDFHLVQDAAPALLKTIEEPPATAVFVVLAEHMPPELVTIASRCVRVDFQPLAPERIAEALVTDGVDRDIALEVAGVAAGNMDRARLLASDVGFSARQALWHDVPRRLDGSGATVATLVDELLASVETLLAPLRKRQEAEVVARQERARQSGEKLGSLKELEARHRRELRRVRIDELRSGLATLAAVHRQRLVSGANPRGCLESLDVIGEANEALIRNPNETLLLQAMLLKLDQVNAGAPAAR